MTPRSESVPRLPNFLIIGAMKSGTTSLYHYLRHHPQIFMPDTKEVNFFNPLRHWGRGVEWYAQQFVEAPDDALMIGEASTSYTKFPWIRNVPARIRSVLGDVRLIYLIRHPIERMRSHYLYNLSTGQEWRPIEDAFANEPMYVNISRYALQLDQYAPHFGREQLLIIESSDLRKDRTAVLGKVFGFLGIDEEWLPPTLDREFYRSADRRMNPPLVRRMRRVPHVREIAMHIPQPVKDLKHRLTGRLATEELDTRRGTISEDLDAHLRESLRDDVALLRDYLGGDFDGWGIA
jgi:hypothetical protein